VKEAVPIGITVLLYSIMILLGKKPIKFQLLSYQKYVKQ